MKFKLIFVMAEDELTDKAIETARSHGATGCTVITSARGEGLKPLQTFLGLTVAGQRDIVLFLVEEHKSRDILEAVASACEFDSKPELEIYADDVVCGHGSTCAEIDPDMVFYFRSRGIPEATARALLIEAFIAEAIDQVEDETVADALSQMARRWLETKRD